MIIKIICLIIWICWFIYGIVGNDINTLKVGLVAGSIVSISHFLKEIIN